MDFDRLTYHFQRAGVTPQVILDVGANKGQWFEECRKRFKCTIHLFEADSDNFASIVDKINQSNNNYGYIPSTLSIGLLGAKKVEEVPFYKAKIANNTGNSMYLENSKYFEDHDVVKLKMDTLDNVIGNTYAKIDLIKLDVQGAELDILRGSVEKALPTCDLILMEVALLQYNKGAPLSGEVFSYMDSIGFQAIDILEKHYFGRDLIQADYLFARKGSVYIPQQFGY
tara:strand:- start:366 stop:1046 length:681 start_codon:yes stop_codon:yes gene_type:complete